MIFFKNKGEWQKTFKSFNKLLQKHYLKKLDKYGEMGVEALSKATPLRTGKTASSWGYRIEEGEGTVSLTWFNTNFNNYVNIAVILQYGHGTRNGGYVTGIDYINPALKPIFEQMADKVWKEVVST